MSLNTEITRIENAKNTLSTKGQELGLTNNEDKVDVIAQKLNDGLVKIQSENIEVSSGETYSIEAGYHDGLGRVTGASIDAVLYSEQILSEQEQFQARKNIGINSNVDPIQNFTILDGDREIHSGLIDSLSFSVTSVSAKALTLKGSQGTVITTPDSQNLDVSTLSDGEYEVFYDSITGAYEIYDKTVVSPYYVDFAPKERKKLWVNNGSYPVTYEFFNGELVVTDVEMFPPLGFFTMKDGEIDITRFKVYQAGDTLTYTALGTKEPIDFDPNEFIEGFGITIDHNNTISVVEEIIKMPLETEASLQAPYLIDSGLSPDKFYSLSIVEGDSEYLVGTNFDDLSLPSTTFNGWGIIDFTFSESVKLKEIKFRNGATAFTTFSLYATDNKTGDSADIFLEKTNVNTAPNEVWAMEFELDKTYDNYVIEMYTDGEPFNIHKFIPSYIAPIGTNVLIKEQVKTNSELISKLSNYDDADVLKSIEQILSDEQKIQARKNINAGNGVYNDLTGLPFINGIEVKGNLTTDDLLISIPTKNSQLTNDTEYITINVNNLLNYYTSTEIDTLISDLVTLSYDIVDTLPTTDISTHTIYMILKAGSENVYDMYMYIAGAWSSLGNTGLDLSNYYTKTETDSLLNNKADAVVKKTELDVVLQDNTEYNLGLITTAQIVDGSTGFGIINFETGEDVIEFTAPINEGWSNTPDNTIVLETNSIYNIVYYYGTWSYQLRAK